MKTNKKTMGIILILLTMMFSIINASPAYAAFIFSNKTTSNGLGSNKVNGVFLNGSTIYAATENGLSISTDGGSSFVNRTVNDGLGHNYVYGVFASGSSVYAGTAMGLSISSDSGVSFINKTTASGLGNKAVTGVQVSGGKIFASTFGGLSISSDGGTSFTNKTSANGLGDNMVRGVYVSGTTIYAATDGGVSISTNGGTSFVNRTTANGLGSNAVYGVFTSGTRVYAATTGGLSISTNSGASFDNKTTADGLGNNITAGVFVSGSMVYVATWDGLSVSENGGSSFFNYNSTSGLGSNSAFGVFASGSTAYAATSGGLSIGKNLLTSRSLYVNDGWILESTQTSAVGGWMNSTSLYLRLGDDAANRQYRVILHFDTSYLPDTAVVTKATLKLKKQGMVGTNPFTILGTLRADMLKPFFGFTAELQLIDFQAIAGKSSAALFSPTPISDWYIAPFTAAGRAYINLMGTTQFRLYFLTGDNGNSKADYLQVYSGNYTAGNRPTLVMEYYVP